MKKTDPLHWDYPVPRFRILWNHHIDQFHPPTFIPLNRAAYIAYGQYTATRPVSPFARITIHLKHQFIRKTKRP